MTNCDKIQTIGTALQDNLNDRGVACIFGNTSGKQTLLDMANLINSNNLLGLGDSVITISASRPYLLSGEKTDITVTLKNGVGTPLVNKTIEISDGTNTYTGITNALGTFVLFDIEISQDTTFTATYDSTVTGSCTVYSPLLLDWGLSTKYTNVFNAMAMFTRQSNGTSAYYQNTGSSTYQVYTSQVAVSDDVAIDFDLVECTSCPIQVARYETGSSTEYVNTALDTTGSVHIEIKTTGTYIYFNNNLIQSSAAQTNMESVRLFFRVTAGNTASFKYKDLAIYTL